MSLELDALQELAEREPKLQWCCDYPIFQTFMSCVTCTFTN